MPLKKNIATDIRYAREDILNGWEEKESRAEKRRNKHGHLIRLRWFLFFQ